MGRADRNRIFGELVSKLAADAASAVGGVSSVGKKGVLFTRDKNTQHLIIDLFLTVERGCKIPEAAWKIQDSVKKTVENGTDTTVDKVNIHIQGVNIKTEN